MMQDLDYILDDIMQKPTNATADRMSVINGAFDFSELSEELLCKKETLLEKYAQEENSIRQNLIKIIFSEIHYQKNDCYQALVLVNSALAFLEQNGYEEAWLSARYIQMCIMIVTGQAPAIFPMVNGMKSRIYASKNERLIQNYVALAAWCALYDDDWEVINSWVNNEAPNEFSEIRLEDTFCYFIKARIYYMQGRYLAAENLLDSLQNVLNSNNRFMELCELYMLMAMCLDASGHTEDAFRWFENCIEIARNRGLIRLLADEGEAIYLLTKRYLRTLEKSNDQVPFLQDVKKASKQMSLLYPVYLKNHKHKYPKLTERELEVLSLIVDDRSNEQIASFLDCSVNTVKFHLKNIFIKFGVSSRKQAKEIAIQEHYFR